jgi:hypothetical protein
MSDDLYAIYENTISEGGDNQEVDSLSRNANVYSGDEEDVTDTEEVSVDEDDSSVDETDEDIDSDTDDGLEDQDDAPEDVFDFDSIKDKPVKVTVGGETFEVPLNELRNGYMRQADYTRKTQQIAAQGELVRWAQDLQEALTSDPKGTVRFFQEQFGLLDDDGIQDDPELGPIVKELRETRRELAELRQSQQVQVQERVNMEVQSELNQMKSKYPDFDPLQVLPIAIDNGLTMEMAYKVWKADRVDQESAVQEAARRKAEQAALKRDKARAATKKVPAVKTKAEADDAWKSFDSFEDIFAYEVERTRS